MQDRAYAVVLVVILAICCLGLYVAVSGYQNSVNPNAVLAKPAAPATLVVVVLNTETPAPVSPGATLAPPPTTAAVPSPLGAFQTITSAATISMPRGSPTSTLRASAPVVLPTPAPPGPVVQSCSAFLFCPTAGGPPDGQLAPTGNPCPRNYVWGRVVDAAGGGLTDMQIRIRGPLGNVEKVLSKGPPDPPGIYNLPAPPPGGNWTIWLIDSNGSQLSPQITIMAPADPAGGNCPTRVDFRAQR